MLSDNRSMTCRLKYFRFPNYWEEVVEDVNSSGQLLMRLEDLQREYVPERNESLYVYVENANRDVLHVGLGPDKWLIVRDRKGGECLVSLGDEAAEGSQVFLVPEWTELPRKYLIPQEVAREVVRMWFETGTLSDSIRWTV